MNEMRGRLIQLLSRYFDIGDSYTYNLARVKSSFAVGTVDLDDFEEYTEDDVANLADYLLDNGVIVPPVKVGQTVHYITGIYGTLIKSAGVHGVYFHGSGWAVTLKTDNNLIFEVEWGIDKVYTTFEDAEVALKEGDKC